MTTATATKKTVAKKTAPKKTVEKKTAPKKTVEKVFDINDYTEYMTKEEITALFTNGEITMEQAFDLQEEMSRRKFKKAPKEKAIKKISRPMCFIKALCDNNGKMDRKALSDECEKLYQASGDATDKKEWKWYKSWYYVNNVLNFGVKVGQFTIDEEKGLITFHGCENVPSIEYDDIMEQKKEKEKEKAEK